MVKIVTDTASGIREDLARRYDITVIPQTIIFGDQAYLEGVDIDYDTFVKRLSSSAVMPKTAAPPPATFAQAFRRLVPLGEPILCIHPSAEVSNTVPFAKLAAAEFPDADIRVLDTRLVATPLVTLALMSLEWSQQGVGIDAIEARLREEMARYRIYFLVDTLDFMVRGGRIGGVAGLLGAPLQIKPILTFVDGKVQVYEKPRTHGRALQRLRQIALDQAAQDGASHLALMYTTHDSECLALADDLRRELRVPDPAIDRVPPAIVTHAGPGVMGVGFFAQS